VLTHSHHTAQNGLAPFFETVIRYLGGFLSAYALTHDPILLTRADDLGTALLPVFDTSSGLPKYGANPKTKATQTGWMGSSTLLAEMASCQLEYKYLAHLTGRKEYFEKVERVSDIMMMEQPDEGLWSTIWSADSGKQSGTQHSIGALADSAVSDCRNCYYDSMQQLTHLTT
jgi:mannosyl-oligosaccharide alpha-1,2-mannosidase